MAYEAPGSFASYKIFENFLNHNHVQIAHARKIEITS